MLAVSLFGGLEVKRNDAVVDISSRPAQLLLAYLVLNPGTSHSRDRLAGLLWPDSDEANAHNNLRQALWRLRKAIGEEYVLSDRISVGFNPSARYQSDVNTLEKTGIEDRSTNALIRDISVYGDILLPGFYEDWVVLEQERWQAIFEDRMQLLLDRLGEEARWREVLNWAERWIAHGSVPEPAYRALMTAHAALGDRAGVVAAFQRCTEMLAEEIGVEPSPETAALFRTLTTTGRVYERQVEPPEWVPAPKLPFQSTPFVGREEELARLGTLLANPATRLVTILGPGGIGKTRLAIETARTRSEAYADGVFFVPLDTLDDPDLAVSLIAEALGRSFYTRHQREQWKSDSQREQLLAYLQDQELLLVLDNLEQLLRTNTGSVSGRPEGIAGLVSDILHAAPKADILTTSRERLGLYGEIPFPLDGLSYPARKTGWERDSLDSADVDRSAAYPAVGLFVMAARRAQSRFELTADCLADVIDICHLVDGMPLGIELSAAWIELLSPAEVAAEIHNSLDFLEIKLRDVPERQHSIRSVIEASCRRLDRTEQELFQKLSVFQGGFTRAAAQNVAGVSLQTLMALMHKSLLRSDTSGRYQMHELLRQHGLEQLAQLPIEEKSARDHHCAYYAAFLKSKEAALVGQNQGEALAAIAEELGNVRAAWDWAVAQGRLDEIELAMESLCEFYRIRGALDEGFETFYPAARALGWKGFGTERAIADSQAVYTETIRFLDEASEPGRSVNRNQFMLGKVLARWGRFYCESPGPAERASQVRQDSLRIMSRLGDRWEMAYILRYTAHVGQTLLEARGLYERALTIFEENSDHRGKAEILNQLGWVATQLGEYDKAEGFYLDSLVLSERLGRKEMAASCQLELGYVYWALGDYRAAEERCHQGFSIMEEIGYPAKKALSLRYMARIAMVREDYGQARHYLQEALGIYRQVGLRGMTALARGELGYIAALDDDLSGARSLSLDSLAVCRELENRQGIVEPLIVLGMVAVRIGDHQEADARFRSALATAMEVWAPAEALHTLLRMASLFQAMGSLQRALELADLVQHHQASWQWLKDQATTLITELEDKLAPEVVALVRACGPTRDLESAVAALLGGSPG